MNRAAPFLSTLALTIVVGIASGPMLAQAPREVRNLREADLCVIPPGAQPSLPAKLFEGMGVTRMPVTTASEAARRFFNQGW